MFIKRLSLFAVLITMLSCGEDPVDPNIAKVQENLDECKARLGGGDYASARNAAEFVMTEPALMSIKDPATGNGHPIVDEVRFCFTTASTLKTVNELTKNLQTLLNVALGVINGEASLAPGPGQPVDLAAAINRLEPQAASLVGTVLDSFMGPVRNTLERNQTEMENILKNKNFRFEISHLPVKIADIELFDAGGIYDLGEIHMLYGLTRTILGTFYTVESVDYNFTIADILEYVTNVPESPLSDFSAQPATAILNVVAVLMSSNPSFLGLERGAGKELMGKAGEAFGAGFAGVLDAIQHMKARKGDQSKYLIEYKQDDATDEDVFILHFDFQNNPLPIIDLNKFNDLQIPLRDDIIEGLTNLKDNFAGAAGVRANLHRDIFPMVALGVVVLLKSGAFDALIETAMQESDPATADQIRSMLGIVANNRDLITGVLATLVPVTIEMDFGHIFRNPVGLRDVFPAWTHPAKSTTGTESPMTPFTTATLVLSYECEDGLNPLQKDPEEFICAKESDASHFADITGDYPWRNNETSGNYGALFEGEIENDGIPVISPYIGFKDASFGGLLYLDVTNIQNEKLPAPDPSLPMPAADLKLLNATIASIVVNVQSFLQ